MRGREDSRTSGESRGERGVAGMNEIAGDVVSRTIPAPNLIARFTTLERVSHAHSFIRRGARGGGGVGVGREGANIQEERAEEGGPSLMDSTTFTPDVSEGILATTTEEAGGDTFLCDTILMAHSP